MSNVVWINSEPGWPRRPKAYRTTPQGGKAVADLDFETQLSRFYGQAPVFRDAELFAQQVTDKLDRGWALRRVLIGATGVVAGVAAAAQLVGARFASEFSEMSQDRAHQLY